MAEAGASIQRIRARYKNVARETPIKGFQEQNGGSNGRLAQAELDIARKQEVEHLNQIDELVDAQQVLQNQNESLRDQRACQAAFIEKLLGRVHRMNEEKKKLVQAIDARDASLRNVRDEVQKMRYRMIEDNKGDAEALRLLPDLKAKIQSRDEDLAKKDSELSARVSELKDKDTQLFEKNQELGKIGAHLSKTKMELRDKDAQLTKQKALAEERFRMMQVQAKSIEKMVHEQRQLRGRDANVQALENQVKQLQEALHDRRAKHEVVEYKHTETSTALEKLKNDSETKQKKYERELVSLKTKIEVLGEQARHLKNENQTLHLESEQREIQYQQKIDEFEMQIEAARKNSESETAVSAANVAAEAERNSFESTFQRQIQRTQTELKEKTNDHKRKLRQFVSRLQLGCYEAGDERLPATQEASPAMVIQLIQMLTNQKSKLQLQVEQLQEQLSSEKSSQSNQSIKIEHDQKRINELAASLLEERKKLKSLESILSQTKEQLREEEGLREEAQAEATYQKDRAEQSENQVQVYQERLTAETQDLIQANGEIDSKLNAAAKRLHKITLERNELKTDLVELSSEREELQLKSESLRQQLRMADTANASLTTQLEESKRKLKKARNKLLETNEANQKTAAQLEANSQLVEELKASKDRVQRLEEKLKNATERLNRELEARRLEAATVEKSREETSKLNEAQKRLTDENHGLREKLAAAEKDGAVAKAHVETLEENVKSYKQQTRALEEKVKEVFTQLTSARMELREATAKVKESQTSLEERHRSIQDLQQRLQDAKEKTIRLSRAVADASRRIEEGGRERRQEESRASELHAIYSQIQTITSKVESIDSKDKRLAELESHILQLQQRNENLRNAIDGHQKESASLREAVGRAGPLAELVKQLQEDNHGLREQHRQLESEVRLLTGKKSKLEAIVEEKSRLHLEAVRAQEAKVKEVGQLASALNETKAGSQAELLTASKGWETAAQRAEAARADLEGKVTRLQEHVEQLTVKAASSEARLEEARHRLQDLNDQLHHSHDEANGMRDEISRLERGLSTSKAHTARYEQDLADIYSSTCGPSIIHTSSGGSGLLFHPASVISDTRPVSADGVRRSTYHPIMSQIDIKKMVLDKVSQLQHSLDDKSSELKELRTKFEERVKRDSERVSLLQAEVSRLSSEAHQRSIEHERDIEGTIADQNREVENCRVDLDIAREELQETQAALQRTQALLQAAEKSSEQQRLRADDLAKDLESNRKRLTDAEARSDGLAASAEAWKAKHIEFSKRVDDMAREIKNRADSSKMIMDQTTAKAKNAEKNEAKLREELKKAEGDARERIVLFEKQIENLTLKLQSVEANLADSKARERGERSRAEAAEKEASGLRGRLLEATEGGGKLLASAGAWEVKHQEQSRLIIRLEAEIESLKEVATLSKQNHSNQIEAARLEVQQAELKFAERMEEVKDLRTRLEASASAHKALEERRFESESLRAKISGLEGELHKTKAELNVVNERNKKISYDWEEKHSAAISRVAELTGEASRLSSEATRVRKEAREGQEKLAKSLALAKAEARTQKEATNASKKEVSKLKEELKKAQEESLNSGEALRTTSEALSKSNNEIKTISSALTEAKASRDSVNSELAALRERLSQSEEGGGILQARHAVQLEKITELNQKLSSIKERNEKLETQLRETAEALKVAEANIKTGKQGEEKMSSEIQDLQHQLKQKTSELQTALLSSLSNKEAQASHEDVFQSRPFLGHRSTQSQPSGLNVEGEEARRVSEILKGLGIRHAFDDTDLNAELASKALIEAIRYSEQANANSTKDEANVILQVANLSKLTNAVVNTRRRLRSQLVAAHDLGRRLLGELVRLTSDVSVWWDRVISLVNDKRVTDEALRAKLKADGRPVWKAKIEQNLREARKEYEAQVDRERVGESKHQESNSMADMDTALDGLRVSLKLEEEIKALRLENTTLREQRKAILKKLKRYNAFYEQVKGSSATEKAKKARYVRRINQLQNRILELERMLKHSNETVAEHRQSLSQIMPADLMGDLTHSASVPNKGDGQRDEVYEELRSSLITQLDQNIRLKEKCRSLETENQRLLSLSHPSVRPALDQMHEEKLMLEQEHTHAKERLLKEMAITRLEFRKLKEERDQLKKEKALWESERRLLRNERTFEQGQNKAQRSQTLSKIKAVQEMMRMRVANLRALHKSFKDHVIQCISNATSDARRIVREEVGAMLRAQPSGEKETKMLHSILSAMESGDASQRRIIEDLQRSLEQSLRESIDFDGECMMSEAYDSGVALAAPQLALASRQARKNASPSKRPLEDTGSLLRYQN